MEGEERECNCEHVRRQLLWKKDVFYSETSGKNKFNISIDLSSRSLVHGEKVQQEILVAANTHNYGGKSMFLRKTRAGFWNTGYKHELYRG